MTGSVSNTLTNSYCRPACTAPSLPPAVAVTGSVSNTELSHDKIDEIGEAINPGEADWVLAYVSRVLLPERPDQRFPGSQPVSLARANMELVWLHRCEKCCVAHFMFRSDSPYMFVTSLPPFCLCTASRVLLYCCTAGTG